MMKALKELGPARATVLVFVGGFLWLLVAGGIVQTVTDMPLETLATAGLFALLWWRVS